MFYIIIILLILLVPLAWGGISMAPWVPVRKKDLGRILRLANLKPGEIFYDLGCGNGRVPFFLSGKTEAKLIGVELAWPLYAICRLRQFFGRGKNLIFKCKNLFKENLEEADVVYVFGMPDKLKDKLREKLERELKKGVRVISYVFPINGWSPETADKPMDKDVAIYRYIIK